MAAAADGLVVKAAVSTLAEDQTPLGIALVTYRGTPGLVALDSDENPIAGMALVDGFR